MKGMTKNSVIQLGNNEGFIVVNENAQSEQRFVQRELAVKYARVDELAFSVASTMEEAEELSPIMWVLS